MFLRVGSGSGSGSFAPWKLQKCKPRSICRRKYMGASKTEVPLMAQNAAFLVTEAPPQVTNIFVDPTPPIPLGSKDPNNWVLGPKYHCYYSIVWVLGPLGILDREPRRLDRRATCFR